MKIKFVSAVVLALGFMPGCVVMRDPIVVSNSAVSIATAPPRVETVVIENGRDEVESQAVPSPNQEVPRDLAARVTSSPQPAQVAASGVRPMRCGEFRLASPGAIPQISAEDYSKIDPKDKGAWIRALTHHVAELYRDSRNYRDRVQAAQVQHRRTCGR